MRAFIAIELPLEIKNSLAKIQDKLKISLPNVSWVKPLNLHLSLKFLGEISLEQLKPIRQIMAETIKLSSPCEIKLETLDVFPNYRQARVIWAGTNQSPVNLKQLAAQLETKLLQLGLAQEQHPFQAHITLGRIKNSVNPADLKRELDKSQNNCRDADLRFNIRGITLFQSVLGPGGPAYSILKEENF